MNHKKLAVATASVLVLLTSITAALFAGASIRVQAIDPAATIAAAAVAVVGGLWFKKTVKSQG